ncbi:sulfate ABC transporter substrate-binding protein [Sandaracinobacteroides saxicola]|uniref:Sulfate ABC transporter substrate-binding protein n=1 Tax=Sandaracinobacteroides saxicola TaxID=2759707 RepID=A0A7G5IGY2_9SPHN|nr:sulfate ABC transporter substrate-binding protein [Sandaracinobacteroides saxicola]QMW22624.1 sulfate ABC transporter substrate-binding protein [Sandaracinobacteroides saxicola]
MNRRLLLAAALLAPLLVAAPVAAQTVTLLNVSYDPTRELYKDVNDAFAADWRTRTGQTVNIRMSHGGSGKQARSVIDGLPADVVTLALGYDIDEIAKNGLIARDWQKRLRFNSTPYFSTIVFLVRKGNPKGIRDWGDLVKPGVQVITPNPKTSGGARWNYLAAWGWALNQPGGSPASARDYVTRLYRNVPVLDTGARGSTTTFVQRGIGDVLLAWENEAFLAKKELGPDKVDIIVPSISVLAEPPVALVDANVRRNGTARVAQAYLDFLYTPAAQRIIGRNYYRPQVQSVSKEFAAQFPRLRLLTINRDFGGWAAAQKTHFDDGGQFDQIFEAAKR